MKLLLFLLAAASSPLLHADDEIPRDPSIRKLNKSDQDPLTIRALARLVKTLGVDFIIPFPKNYDIDVHSRQPLAVLDIDGKKVGVTKPCLNPYDAPYQTYWMIGPEDPEKLALNDLYCTIDLDKQGEIIRCSLMSDWSSDGTGRHDMERGAGETSADFFQRARLTYQFRAKTAKDSSMALLQLMAFEKIALTIQTLRKEEATKPAPPVLQKR